MKTIKIIDLLNKIANGEEVPKKIKYEYTEYELSLSSKNYYRTDRSEDLLSIVSGDELNDIVEILDEEDEFEDIESFGVHYSWDYIDYKNIEELKKYINKDFQNIFDTLDKLIKNQKKIIERLKDGE